MSHAADQSLEQVIGRFAPQREYLLPILHAVQAGFGHVSSAAVARIADYLNLSRAEVHGVVTFYHDFHESPRHGRRIRVCVAEACQSVGARSLFNEMAQRAGSQQQGNSAAGHAAVEPVYCLGLCACGPAVMVDGQLHGRMTLQKIDSLIAQEPAA